MLPARLALCDLEAPNWGSLGFRIVLLLLPGSQIAVWHFRGLLFALVLFCHTNPKGDTMLSSLLILFK